MAKTILKRGKLSIVETSFITLKHNDFTVEQMAKELKRSESQVQKFIDDNLKGGASEENQEKLASQVHIESKGVANVMTEAEAGKPAVTGRREDPPWIFRQPVK